MEADSSRHLEEQEIERYSLGDASEETLEKWDEHLLVCAGCRSKVEESDRYVRAMRGAAGRIRRKTLQTEGRRWWALPRLTPVLAGLAAVALGILLWRGGWLRSGEASPVAVALATSRGPSMEAQAPAGAPLVLRPDLTALPEWPSYRLEMVNSNGEAVWQGSFPGKAVTRPMSEGVYFVRIYSPKGDLYREYALRVQEKK